MADDTQSRRISTLVWGVKQSFRSYVEATGGAITTSGGAERLADGEFAFAAAPDSDLGLDASGKPEGRGKFLGEVRFESHGGMLSVRLADPAIDITGTEAVLSVDDGFRRVEIVRLDLAAMTGGEGGQAVIPTALSMDGSQVLGDHYPPRTVIDPVRLQPD